jgi:hypothetical protein
MKQNTWKVSIGMETQRLNNDSERHGNYAFVFAG